MISADTDILHRKYPPMPIPVDPFKKNVSTDDDNILVMYIGYVDWQGSADTLSNTADTWQFDTSTNAPP